MQGADVANAAMQNDAELLSRRKVVADIVRSSYDVSSRDDQVLLRPIIACGAMMVGWHDSTAMQRRTAAAAAAVAATAAAGEPLQDTQASS